LGSAATAVLLPPFARGFPGALYSVLRRSQNLARSRRNRTIDPDGSSNDVYQRDVVGYDRRTPDPACPDSARHWRAKFEPS
jgi:hypothetical protein